MTMGRRLLGRWEVAKLWLLPIMLLVVMLHHQAGSTSSSQGEEFNAWDPIIAGLPELDGPAFRDRVAAPLVQMNANAYRYPDRLCVDIPGWILSSKLAPIAPPKGGVHALIYEEENHGGRMVVTFRGTQLGDTIDCDADLCADARLWVPPGAESCPLPVGMCEKFDDATLDYFSQAVEYTRKAIDAYPPASLLLSGHSLGAGLAVLVSAALSTHHSTIPVIGFSSAGARSALRVRNLTLDAEHKKSIIIIADQWDEIMRTSWEEQLGLLCLYNTTLNPYCEKCFESPTPCASETITTRRSLVEGDSGLANCATKSNCKECFLRTHYLAKVIDTIQEGTQPACKFIA